MFKMRSEILVLKNTNFLYKIQISGCQNTNFCFSKLAGLPLTQAMNNTLILSTKFALWLTPDDPCMTFDLSKVLCSGYGFVPPNLVAIGHS